MTDPVPLAVLLRWIRTRREVEAQMEAARMAVVARQLRDMRTAS